MQQGRVQLDADWNEQLTIEHHRDQTALRDVIGGCGAPKEGDSFRIVQAPRYGDLLIEPGRFYVDGLLCELEATPVSITSFPANNQAIVPWLFVDGRYLAPGHWVEIRAAGLADPIQARIQTVQ